jgi:hypothetical protein
VIGTRNPEITNSVISSFTRQNEELTKSLIQLQYYFRGAYTRDDVWTMSHAERELSIEFLNNRFKDAGELIKKSIPVFL